ncbi:MAG: hypothetical protein OXU67_03150 [Chloroflexota bacterium]|nr:hypothetical protein [Chloroflexota bacterium]
MTAETTAAPPAETAVTVDAITLAAIYDRLGHIEGALPHFATKADIADLRADGERLRADMAQLRADFERQLRLMTWTLAGVILAGMTLLVAILRLWGG